MSCLIIRFLVTSYLIDVALHIFEMFLVLCLLSETNPKVFSFGLRKFAFLLGKNCFALLLVFLLLLMKRLHLYNHGITLV